MAPDTKANREIILRWLGDLAQLVVADTTDLADLTARIAVAGDLDAHGFAGEAIDIMRVIGESTVSPQDFDRIAMPVGDKATTDAASVILAMGLSISGVKVAWPSRPRARAARSRISAVADNALGVAFALGGDGADLHHWLADVTGTSVRVVSDIAANAVPVVRVETGISMSASVLAYRLYGDAKRAEALVEISGSRTPGIMPISFDALAE